MIEYEYNEREVTAIIHDCQDDVVNMLRRRMKSEDISESMIKAATMPEVFKARARCHPDDEYIQKKGEELATHRVLDAYHERRARKERQLARVFERSIASCGLFVVEDM